MTDSADSSDAGATGATGMASDTAPSDWSAPTNHEWGASETAWAPSPPPETAKTAEETAAVIASWQQESPAGWPAPRVEEAIVAINEPAADQPSTSDHPENVGTGQPDLAEAIRRADQLLDELRTTIAAIGGTRVPDLSAVIYELEVALTPPAALQTDDLTGLRETLHSASERPRDIDTILELTQRLGTISALLIAYDRSIAAIERSLDTLRGAEPHHPPAWEA